MQIPTRLKMPTVRMVASGEKCPEVVESSILSHQPGSKSPQKVGNSPAPQVISMIGMLCERFPGHKARWLCRPFFQMNFQAGQGGRLFGAVTAKDIAEAVGKVTGETVDKRKIVLDADIKNYGRYEIEVKIHPGVSAKLAVVVEE